MGILFLVAMSAVDADTYKALAIMGVSGTYLYLFAKANGYLYEKFNKKTRSADTHASSKVKDFKKLSDNIIAERDERCNIGL